MNYKISLRERAKLSMEQISKQLPVTLEIAREQALWLQKETNLKKQEEKFIKQFCDLVKNYFFTYCKFTSLLGYNPIEVLITDFLMETVVFNQENAGGLGSGEKVGVEIDGGL